MRLPFATPLLAAVIPLALWTGAAACGGNVIVDGAGGASSTGATGTGATGTGATGTGGTGTGTDTAIQVPDAGNGACEQDYLSVVGNLEAAFGCTPTADIPQCTGKYLLHDPCGCLHVANDAHLDLIMFGQNLWTSCVSDSCCGPQATIGCSPCPPAPTAGVCNATTSQCQPSG